MDPIILTVLIAVALIAALRLRWTFLRSRKPDQGEKIKRKLAELRKKRDED
jgi:hypothetical protein